MEFVQWAIVSSLSVIAFGKTVHVYRPMNLQEHKLNPTGCGGVVHQRTGTITSPRYPGSYPANAFCFWEIYIPEGDILSLDFDDFNIEQPDTETKYCMSDKLVIIHHIHGEADPIPRYYCGDDPPPTLTYKGYKMVIGFISDSIMERRGFRANYTMFRDPDLVVREKYDDVTDVTEPRHVPVYRECGGTIADVAATIQSPGYPNSYGSDMTCIWQIRRAHEDPIFLMFDDLDLEDSDDCRHDYIDIYDGNNQHLAK
ncbi:hypothetical protein LSH36_814g03059 [Paralvinella palmiformis]|uniref:CUB domain-containing protein n=1 Tax=Paralvinella palmiformis TaxID=53620 RepID=A0AAD9MS59_9ANNE|nr:hypothetical protein LSH36_814g03059 [Paralvinella palmiformis]